jgi:hypothetical protein
VDRQADDILKTIISYLWDLKTCKSIKLKIALLLGFFFCLFVCLLACLPPPLQCKYFLACMLQCVGKEKGMAVKCYISDHYNKMCIRQMFTKF